MRKVNYEKSLHIIVNSDVTDTEIISMNLKIVKVNFSSHSRSFNSIIICPKLNITFCIKILS